MSVIYKKCQSHPSAFWGWNYQWEHLAVAPAAPVWDYFHFRPLLAHSWPIRTSPLLMGLGNPSCLSITWECNTGRNIGRLHLKNILPFSAVPLFTALKSYTQPLQAIHNNYYEDYYQKCILIEIDQYHCFQLCVPGHFFREPKKLLQQLHKNRWFSKECDLLRVI